MNCINHPTEQAVAQCTDCGKGLCAQCVADQKMPLCESCRQRQQQKSIISSVVFLVIYAVLFTVGYKLNFMASKGSPDTHLSSGYMLMAVVSGWQFLNNVIHWRLIQGTLVTWVIYYLLKTLAAAIVGVFTAPITILWNVIKIILNCLR